MSDHIALFALQRECFLERFFLFLIILFLLGCAGVQSGHYIQVQRGESLSGISQKLAVGVKKIKSYNPQANFSLGEWIFIPLKRGLMSTNSRDSWVSSVYGGRLKPLWPVPSSQVISSFFGRRWGRRHNGIDIKARGGAKIMAVADGKVIYSARRLQSFGNMIVIRHDHGIYTLYAHNQTNYVQRGQSVRRGQVIGRVGHTGRSTGNHLHFEIRLKDEAINPLAFYDKVKQGVYARR